jgi:hypothetical protein
LISNLEKIMVKEGAISELAIFKGTDEEYRKLAKRLFHDEGVIEIDDNARIAKGAECGAYVEAWVWVDNPNWSSGGEECLSTRVSGEEEV